MTECSTTETILEKGLNTCAELYKQEISGFQPRNGLIHESNLVRLYIEALKKDSRNVFGWTEYLNGHGKRVDAVIKIGNDLVLLEAKRIKQGAWGKTYNADNSIKSIIKDSVRLFDEGFYKAIVDDLNVSGAVYRVLISAIWLFKGDDTKNKVMDNAKNNFLKKDGFQKEWDNAYTKEISNVCPDYSETSTSKLSLLIAIAKP